MFRRAHPVWRHRRFHVQPVALELCARREFGPCLAGGGEDRTFAIRAILSKSLREQLQGIAASAW